MGAILSLEALLPLVVAFVRDLQQEAVAYLPRITAVMADLVDAGEPVSCCAMLLIQRWGGGDGVFGKWWAVTLRSGWLDLCTCPSLVVVRCWFRAGLSVLPWR